MKNWFKKLLAYSAAACIMFTGCSAPDAGDTGDKKTADGKNTAMGRYVEEELPLPEGIGRVSSLVGKKDATLEMIYNKTSPATVGPYEMVTSADGKSWTKKEAPWLDQLSDCMILEVAYDAEDNILVRYQKASQAMLDMVQGKIPADTREEDIIAMEASLPPVMDMMVAADGTASEPYEAPFSQRNDSPTYGKLLLAANGDTIANDFDAILQYDATTHAIKNVYPLPENMYAPETLICGDTLCVDAGTYIEMFDLNTGEKIGDTAEKSAENTTGSGGMNVAVKVQEEEKIMGASPDGKSFFYSNSTGIYRQVIGGAVSEKLVEGELTSFNMPSLYGNTLVPIEEDHIIVLFSSSEGQVMMSYKYSADTPTVPETELKVYSLNDSKTVRQTMALFQRKHPDVHVIYTVAKSDSGSVTVSDLLRTLSTELLAGKGPDILIMDDMPINSYIEKDVLMDLSEILDPEIAERKYLENIISFGKQTDGKQYAVPTRFTIPVILSSNEVIDSITDFSSFISATEKLQKESADKYDEGVLNIGNPEMLIRQFANVCYPTWIKDDGSINNESLSDFLSGIKKIADPSLPYSPEENMNYNYLPALTMTWLYDHNAIGIANLQSIQQYSYPMAGIDQKGSGKLALAPGQVSNVFLPGTIAGINKNTKQADLSKDFIKMILSEEVQSNSFDDGISVNTAAYEKAFANPYADYDDGMSIAMMSTNGRQESLQIIWPSEEQLEQLKADVNSLYMPSVVDKTVVDVIAEQSKDYFTDAKTIEETITAISQNLEMYLSE